MNTSKSMYRFSENQDKKMLAALMIAAFGIILFAVLAWMFQN